MSNSELERLIRYARENSIDLLRPSDWPTLRLDSPGGRGLLLRPLVNFEKPFRGCLGADCSTTTRFFRGLEPHHVFYAITDQNRRPLGQIELVLGEAANRPVAFVERVQIPNRFSHLELSGVIHALLAATATMGSELAMLSHTDDYHKLGHPIGNVATMVTRLQQALDRNFRLSVPIHGFRRHEDRYQGSETRFAYIADKVGKEGSVLRQVEAKEITETVSILSVTGKKPDDRFSATIFAQMHARVSALILNLDLSTITQDQRLQFFLGERPPDFVGPGLALLKDRLGFSAWLRAASPDPPNFSLETPRAMNTSEVLKMKASVFHRLYHHRPLTDQQKEFLIYHYHPRLPFPFFPDTLTPDDLADVQLSLIDYAIGHLSADSATAKLMVSHPLLLGHHEAAMAELLKAFQRWQTSLHEILGVFSHPDMRISDALEDQLLKDLLADPIRFDERQAVAILSLLTQDRKMARMADEFFHHLIANRSLPSLWAANPGHFSDHWVGKVLLVLRRILPRLNSADRQYLLSTLKPIANGNRNEVQSDDRLGLSELLYRLEGPICRDNLF